METIHIEGWSDELNIVEKLSDNYRLNVSFRFDKESKEIIPNVFFRFYECPEKCSLEKAVEYTLKKEFGDLLLIGQDYGYSEYTIEGFEISTAKIGGHNLNDIIKSKQKKYLHILIDQINLSKNKKLV